MAVKAYISITVAAGKMDDVTKAVRHLLGVTDIAAVTGSYDVIAAIQVTDLAALGNPVKTSVQGSDGMVHTPTGVSVS
jgi:DNA-binding Lrp family transcriptional regulator